MERKLSKTFEKPESFNLYAHLLSHLYTFLKLQEQTPSIEQHQGLFWYCIKGTFNHEMATHRENSDIIGSMERNFYEYQQLANGRETRLLRFIQRGQPNNPGCGNHQKSTGNK